MNGKMSETILIECLDYLEQGDALPEILARYPEHAAELRPFLEIAAMLPQLASQPTLAAKNSSRDAFLAQAAAMKASPRTAVSFWQRLRRVLAPVAALALILLLLSAALIPVSAAALPGDTLYGAKLFVEEVQLRLTSDAEAMARLADQFREERIREVESLLRAGRSADVGFEGRIEALGVTSWTVAGLQVLLQDSTVIEGTPREGALAQVYGRTDGGQLLGERLIVLTGSRLPDVIPDATPTPTVTATPEPSVIAEPSVTPTPTATPSATPEATLTLSPTAVPTETSGAAPPATPQPPPPDDGNSNDDGANDNGGDKNDNDDGDDNANDDDNNDNNAGEDNGGDNDGGGDDDGNDNDDNDNDAGEDSGGDNDGGGDDDDNDNDGGGDDDDNDNDGGDDNAGNDNDGGDDDDDNDNDYNDNDGGDGDDVGALSRAIALVA